MTELHSENVRMTNVPDIAEIFVWRLERLKLQTIRNAAPRSSEFLSSLLSMNAATALIRQSERRISTSGKNEPTGGFETWAGLETDGLLLDLTARIMSLTLARPNFPVDRSEPSTPAVPLYRYWCPICPKGFLGLRSYERHVHIRGTPELGDYE